MEIQPLPWVSSYAKLKAHIGDKNDVQMAALSRAARKAGLSEPVKTKGGLLIAPIEKTIASEEVRNYKLLPADLDAFLEREQWVTEWMIEANEIGGTQQPDPPRSGRGGAHIYCGRSGGRLKAVFTNIGRVKGAHAKFVVPVTLHRVEFGYKPSSTRDTPSGFLYWAIITQLSIQNDEIGTYLEEEELWVAQGDLNKLSIPDDQFLDAFEAAHRKALTLNCDRPFFYN